MSNNNITDCTGEARQWVRRVALNREIKRLKGLLEIAADQQLRGELQYRISGLTAELETLRRAYTPVQKPVKFYAIEEVTAKCA